MLWSIKKVLTVTILHSISSFSQVMEPFVDTSNSVAAHRMSISSASLKVCVCCWVAFYVYNQHMYINCITSSVCTIDVI